MTAISVCGNWLGTGGRKAFPGSHTLANPTMSGAKRMCTPNPYLTDMIPPICIPVRGIFAPSVSEKLMLERTYQGGKYQPIIGPQSLPHNLSAIQAEADGDIWKNQANDTSSEDIWLLVIILVRHPIRDIRFRWSCHDDELPGDRMGEAQGERR
jgi:hypothetical protein